MKLDLFDYPLPPEAIAQTACEPRDASRLLVVHRDTGALEHRVFCDILEYLSPGDVLVVNNTRVRSARLTAHRTTGARVEVLVLDLLSPTTAHVLVRPGKRAIPGNRLVFEDGRQALVVTQTDDGGRVLDFGEGGDLEPWLESYGHVPLPPYIHRDLPDAARYQTVYSRLLGSAAAPTAGLHFTPDLLQRARQKGVQIVEVTLHVGVDTFRPVKTPDIESHEMHSEWFHVPEIVADTISQAAGRIFAVGTTSVRTLESAAVGIRRLRAGAGVTRLYVQPGYKFRCVDALVTNFHVPRSSLMILVSALAGRNLIMRAYHEALASDYRFLSLGDAMLIL